MCSSSWLVPSSEQSCSLRAQLSATDENSSDLDSVDRVAYLRAHLVQNTNRSCKRHAFGTAYVTSHWSPYIYLFNFKKPKSHSYTTLTMYSTAESSCIYSHAEDTAAFYPTVVVSVGTARSGSIMILSEIFTNFSSGCF